MMREEWCNKDDQAFYQFIPKEVLKKLYGAGGMLSCLNGKISASFFAIIKGAAGTTLEVGAGSGRIIGELKKQGYKEENIIAVERNADFVADLKHQFPKLNIHDDSIQNFQSDQKFDHIGCWYSLLMEFNAAEQLELLTKLSQLSKPTTIIIIDIVPSGLESNATHATGQNVKIQLEGVPPIHGYSPTLNELQRHAKTINMEIAFVSYWTDTGRKRVQCILVPEKSPYLSQVQQLARIKSEFFERQHAYAQHRVKGQNSSEVAHVLKNTIF